MKRLISIILTLTTLVLVIPTLSVPAFAAYENTYTNTGNQIEDIIGVATTQTGYCEGNSSSQLAGTVAGSGNYTKYGSWYGINPGAWCAMFVSWCANQAGISTSIIPRHASCDIGMNWFKSNGRWYYSRYFGGQYTPKRGDIIYFGNNPSNLNDSTHVGIVTGTDSSNVYTIEGNKSNKCKTYSYSLQSSYIFGYGTPLYASAQSYPTGTYVVSASSLNMRSSASTAGTILTVLSAGDYVDITAVSGKWGYTSYGTYKGWISLAYCSSVSAMRYTVSDNGIEHLKTLEGYSQYKYWDNSQWSIGYGTGCGENDYPNGITMAEADTLLRSAVVKYEVWLNTFLYNNGIDLNQNQYDALVSFTYNLGNIWSGDFTLKTYLINGISKYTDAQIAAAFGEKVYVSGTVNQGLVNRRAAESALFCTPPTGGETEYTLTLDVAGGTITSGKSSYSISYGEYYCDVIGTLPVAVREGFTFDGWYNEKYDYKLSVAQSEYFAVNEDVTFTALWKASAASYTVSYNANGGSGAPASQTKTAGTSLTLTSAVPSRVGYVFAGWAKTSAGSVEYPAGGSYNADEGATLYAVWIENPLGTTTSYLVTASSLNIRNLPTTTGSTVLGSVAGGQIFNVSTISGTWGYTTFGSVSGWISLSASYSNQVYGIFYNVVNGGTASIDNAVKTKGDTFHLTSTLPVRAGYTFLGWSVSQTATVPTYLPGALYSASEYAFLYDIWKKNVSSYTIAYNANGGTGAPASQTKTTGNALKLSSTVPVRSGYSFLGWAVSSGAQIPDYSAGGTYTADTGVTLYAVWQAKTYTVAYNANGGTGSPTSQTKSHGTLLTLSGDIPLRDGYSFLGWATSSVATTAEYLAGGSFNTNSDTTLFAVWSRTVSSYTLTLNPGDAEFSYETEWEISYGDVYSDVFGTVPIPSKNGYTFDGWYCAEYGCYITNDGIYQINGDATFTACWTEDAEISLSLSNYTVTCTGLTGISVIRWAKGEYETISDLKAAPGAKSASKDKVYEGTEVTADDGGRYTFCFQRTDGTAVFKIVDIEKMQPTCSFDGLNIRVDNLYGIMRTTVAPGHYTTHKEARNAIGARSASSATVTNKSYTFLIDQTYLGEYTAVVEYTNGDIYFFYGEMNINLPIITSNGRTMTLSNLDDVSIVRYAPGEYTTVKSIKSAEGSKSFRIPNGTQSYNRYVALDGVYTVYVKYTNGYERYFNMTIVNTAPSFNVGTNSVTVSNLTGLSIMRYAQGIFSNDKQIKSAVGNKLVRGSYFSGDSYTVTGLTAGAYTFYTYYTNQSSGVYTVTVK